MQKGLEYTYNHITGLVTLTSAIYALELLTVTFDPLIVVPVPVPSGGDFNVVLITADTVLTSDNFGLSLIVEPTLSYCEITLPAIANVQGGRPLAIEIGGVGAKCVRFKDATGATLIFGCPGETFTIYKFVRDINLNLYEWRVKNAVGNFKTVGRTFHSTDDVANMINAVLENGDGLFATTYARLYDWVSKLSTAKRCTYADWSTGTNYLKFSLKDPTTGIFHIPDTRNLFTRNTSMARDAGIFQDHAIIDHAHFGKRGDAYTGSAEKATGYVGGGQQANLQPDFLTKGVSGTDGSILPNIATETRPVNNSMNQFILV